MKQINFEVMFENYRKLDSAFADLIVDNPRLPTLVAILAGARLLSLAILAAAATISEAIVEKGE